MENDTELNNIEAPVESALEPTLAENVKRLVKELIDERLADTRLEAYRQGVNERIDALLHDLPALNGDNEAAAEEVSSPLPRLTRRSIWNNE